MDLDAFLPILTEIEKELGVTILPPLREKLFERVALQKYDLQDQAFVEKILEDEEKTFIENFTGSFLDLAKAAGKGAELESFLSSTEGEESFIDMFIKNIDHLLNYFYNVLIGAHLSGG